MGGSPIPFAGSKLDSMRHVCAFFNSDDEAYRVLLPFIKDGFACGDKAVHVINPNRCACHLNRLVDEGIDVAAVRESGQLEIRATTETYLKDGRFEQDRMLGMFEDLASRNDGREFPLSRIICQMDWAAENPLLIDDVVAFEARVNDVWCRHDDAVICVYDLARLSGDTVIDIMRTHPMVVIGGTLHENPFYVPPGEFLLELLARRGRRGTPAGGA